MKKYSLSAMAAAGLLVGGLSATSATAADLGGNCCADLEERIAELEATTVRKGNRKVSLTISGWVAEQVTWWDDGHEQNTYVGGIGTTLGTNVKFTGQAVIAPGWTAGYVIHLEMDGSDTLAGTNQFVPDGPGLFAGNPNYVQALQSFWFMKSDHLGKVSVGLQSMAADNAAILVDGSGSLVVANWVGFNTEGFFLRRNDANAANFGYTGNIWAQAGGCNNGGDCYGIPINGVRYDTPTFAGFSGSAGWGEDDYWDMAARYAGEFWGWKVAGAAAYAKSTCAQTGPFTGANTPDLDGNSLTTEVIGGCPFPVNFGDTNYFQAGLYIEHVPWGLFVLGNYGDFSVDGVDQSSETWYGKVGIRQRWHPLGHTVLYGEYQHNDGGGVISGVSPCAFNSATGSPGAGASCDDGNFTIATSSESHWWGAGIVQEIDAAAMSVWLRWRQTSYEDNSTVFDGANFVGTSYDDLQEVTFGGLINF